MTEKISQPLGSQPSVYEWSRTLRSRSPSPTRLSNSNVKDGPTKISTANFKRTDSGNLLRKSTGNLAAGFTGKLNKSTNDLANIEAEYIKNLQQQIYFLELEANYLRDQTHRAKEMHPKMTHEAEKMLEKLRQMHNEMEGMRLEMRRKDSSIEVKTVEKQRIEEKLKEEMGDRFREKRLMTDEVVNIKKEKDRLVREVTHKDKQLLEAATEIDKSSVALKSAELKLTTLKNQLDQRVEQHKLTQLALEEKRSEMLKTETQLRELEDKYYSSTVTIQDKVTQDLRDEIRFLRQKLKETELSAEKDRFLREKISDDSSHLVRENAVLSQQISELQNLLEREQGLRESSDQRHSQNIIELVSVRDKEKQLMFEIEQVKEQLRKEQEKSHHYLEQLTRQETEKNATELQLNMSKSLVSELQSAQNASDSENLQLRKDKMLLVDHVADLQSKAEEKEREILRLQQENTAMETRLKDYEYNKTLEQSAQSQKWEEFGRLAESMRTLSHTMAASTTPRTSSKILHY